MTIERKELDSAFEALEQTATSIARSLPADRKQEMHNTMVTKELKTLVQSLHYINALFGGMSESAILGLVVDNLFYEVKVTTKDFQSESEANDFAQQRHDQLKD